MRIIKRLKNNLASPAPGEELATALIEQTEADATPLDGFLITLRSASSKRAPEIARMQIEKHHQKVMTSALRGDLAPQRAAMVLSLIAGFQVMRQMIGFSALAKAKPEALVKIFAPVFKLLVDDGQARVSRNRG